MGLGPFLILSNCSHHAKRILNSCCEKWCCVPITSKSFAGAPFAVMLGCWFVGCCCFGLGEDQRSICVGALFSISSLISSHITDFISSFSSRSLFFFLCLLPFSCFSFSFSCSSLCLFLFLSICFSLGQFLTWAQHYFHNLYS